MAKRKYKRLHYEDRQTIEAMSKQGSSVSDIAEVLGTHRDTIYREFKLCIWYKSIFVCAAIFCLSFVSLVYNACCPAAAV